MWEGRGARLCTDECFPYRLSGRAKKKKKKGSIFLFTCDYRILIFFIIYFFYLFFIFFDFLIVLYI